MMKNYDVIVIGGGPAGLFSAFRCASYGLNVSLLEKNKSFGKKLLITGAGQCNLTQDKPIGEFVYHYGTNTNFVKHCLYTFSNDDFRKFLHKNKLSTVSMENGKVFPKSMKASDVLNVLENVCREKHVNMLTQMDVKRITKNGELFVTETENSTLYSKYVVISTGGTSYPQTGSTGSGHILAKNLGHKIRPTKFALAPLYIKNFELAEFSGLSFENLSFTHWRGGKKIGDYSGDVLITHRGISGPSVLNNSRYMVKNDIIKINFLGTTVEDARGALRLLLNNGGKKWVRTVAYELNLSKRLMDYFIKTAGIHKDLKCAELTKATRSKLLSFLTEYEMEIKEVGHAATAMVTAGGVSLKEVNPKTMESRKIDGLYFAGEVLDIDGDTGGYNIQAAVSMGYVVGQSISNKERSH
jgi:predicted Rossmann fold flavoprotein